MKKDIIGKILKITVCLLFFTCLLTVKGYTAEPEILYKDNQTIDTTTLKFSVKRNENKLYTEKIKVTLDTVQLVSVNDPSYNSEDDSYVWEVIFDGGSGDKSVIANITIPYLDAVTNTDKEKTGVINFNYKAQAKPIIRCDGSESTDVKETTSTEFEIVVDPNKCDLQLKDISIKGNGIAIHKIDDGQITNEGFFTKKVRFINPDGAITFTIDVEVNYSINGEKKKIIKSFERKYKTSITPQILCPASEAEVYGSNAVEIEILKNGWEILSVTYEITNGNIEKVKTEKMHDTNRHVELVTLKDLVSGEDFKIKVIVTYGKGGAKSELIKEFEVSYGIISSSIGSPDNLATLLDPNQSLGSIVLGFLKIIAAILTFVSVITVGVNMVLARNKADQRNNSMSGFLYIIVGIILFDIALILYSFFSSSVGDLDEQVDELIQKSESSEEDTEN